MKVLGVALLLLLLLVVGVFVYVGYNTNSIVKNAIETIGTQYLGAPVNVKEVEIALQEGRGTLKELEIGNPPGYAGAYAMRFGTVSVEIDPAQSTRDLIVLKRITIDGARAAAIANTPQETNFRALSSNIPSSNTPTSSGGSKGKLIVDKLDLTNTQATLSSPLLPRAYEVNVPDVHLTDIGRSSNGVDAATVVAQVLEPITKAVTRKMTDAARKGLGVDPNQFESEAVQRMRDTLKSLGHPTN
jgi:hypothetical protein